MAKIIGGINYSRITSDLKIPIEDPKDRQFGELIDSLIPEVSYPSVMGRVEINGIPSPLILNTGNLNDVQIGPENFSAGEIITQSLVRKPYFDDTSYGYSLTNVLYTPERDLLVIPYLTPGEIRTQLFFRLKNMDRCKTISKAINIYYLRSFDLEQELPRGGVEALCFNRRDRVSKTTACYRPIFFNLDSRDIRIKGVYLWRHMDVYYDGQCEIHTK